MILHHEDKKEIDRVLHTLQSTSSLLGSFGDMYRAILLGKSTKTASQQIQSVEGEAENMASRGRIGNVSRCDMHLSIYYSVAAASACIAGEIAFYVFPFLSTCHRLPKPSSSSSSSFYSPQKRLIAGNLHTTTGSLEWIS